MNLPPDFGDGAGLEAGEFWDQLFGGVAGGVGGRLNDVNDDDVDVVVENESTESPLS